MKKDYLHLHKILQVDKWQTLQDSLSAATGLAIITVDYKGVPVTKHSGCQPFCQTVREDGELSKICQRCDSRGGLEAARINQPYVYRCHYNIVDAAIPILVEDKYIGAIMAGQIMLPPDQSPHELEGICTPREGQKEALEHGDLRSKYRQLPVLSWAQVRSAVEMLDKLCSYVVEEAIEKQMIFDLYADKNRDLIQLDLEGGLYTKASLEQLTDRQNRQTDKILQADTELKADPISSTLKPALDYIYHHRQENPSLTSMAERCHISPSYFSRLFQKEMGECYSGYLGQLKSNWGKQLLSGTDLSIAQIGDSLGYGDASYFIKVFKKYHGVTPALYRKYYPQDVN